MVSDTTVTARANVVEGARLVTVTCSWLADQSKNAGKVTRDACMWMALAGLAATVADLAESMYHPTFTERLSRDCDGTESALLMLRALSALQSGEHEQAEMLATLAARTGGAL